MKKAYLATAILSAVLLTACGTDKKEEEAKASEQSTVELQTDAQMQSYALGVSMGLFITNRFEQQDELNLPHDLEALRAGFEDGLNDNQRMTMEDIQFYAQASDDALREAQKVQAEKVAEEAIEAGKAFLAENAEREGVTVTDSGLQYEVIEAADGPSPKATDTVTVHYRGTLIDGTEFDSSYSRGEPASFPLNRVISGWTEGLQLMQVGSKYRFYIPSELAYGPRGQGAITPNSTLLFDVELLEIASAEEPVE